MRLLAVLAATCAAAAAFPHSRPPFHRPRHEKIDVAVIGAGPGGSSTAYYLKQFGGSRYDVTVFERNDYVGGRSTTVNIHDDDDYPVELGASIFITENYILQAAVAKFGLDLVDGDFSDPDPNAVPLGVFNGRNFTFVEVDDYSVEEAFGIDPVLATYSTADYVVGQFLQWYNPGVLPIADLSALNAASNLTQATGQYATGLYGNSSFVNVLVSGATRVNYASSIDDITGMGATLTLSGSGDYAVAGGNRQIFKKMVSHSDADLKLETTVVSVYRNNITKKWDVTYWKQDDREIKIKSFDRVVVAAPWYQTGIIMDVANPPENVPYRELWVTIFTTRARPDPTRFGLARGEMVPDSIFTNDFGFTGYTAAGLPQFLSFNIVDYLKEKHEYVYKVFTYQNLSDSDVRAFFANGTKITWTTRKFWNPYPVLSPVTDFGAWEVADGLYYPSIMERFGSCMETAALAGANVAALMVAKDGTNTTAIEL
ncbi:Prenylcysteine lyase-domain-containing protein [Dipodascopsis tothii]|uniref:Prenylcysteine lyase-domain-containing protein n=1 Tax=Dipodascopsis tothii TaxID=44089 RepID=UPI0034CEBEA7